MKNQECRTTKVCVTCLEEKDLVGCFYKNKSSKDGYLTQCKDCLKKKRQNLIFTNPVAYQNSLVASRFAKEGLTKEHLAKSKADWDARNSEHVKEYRRDYYTNNYEACLKAGIQHYTRVKRASVSWGNRQEMIKFYKEAKHLTKTTGIKHSVDHIIPLKGKNVSGLHVESNLQVIKLVDNNRKFNKF